MSALELKFTVFLEPISFLALGNLVFKNLRTLGHLMDSTMLISPPLTLYPSLSIFSNIEFSNNSAAEGLISSYTVRHILTSLLIFYEYLGGI